MIGVSGTSGARNGRTRSGSLYRSTITPADTSTNANSVPMFVRSTTSAMLANAANDRHEQSREDGADVRRLEPRDAPRARNGGSSPSRAIDMKMRGWPELEHQQHAAHGDHRAERHDEPRRVEQRGRARRPAPAR